MKVGWLDSLGEQEGQLEGGVVSHEGPDQSGSRTDQGTRLMSRTATRWPLPYSLADPKTWSERTRRPGAREDDSCGEGAAGTLAVSRPTVVTIEKPVGTARSGIILMSPRRPKGQDPVAHQFGDMLSSKTRDRAAHGLR